MCQCTAKISLEYCVIPLEFLINAYYFKFNTSLEVYKIIVIQASESSEIGKEMTRCLVIEFKRKCRLKLENGEFSSSEFATSKFDVNNNMEYITLPNYEPQVLLIISSIRKFSVT